MTNNKRITTNLSPAVKVRLSEIKAHLELKTESQVIGYLTALFAEKYPELTLREHKACLEASDDLNGQ